MRVTTYKGYHILSVFSLLFFQHSFIENKGEGKKKNQKTFVG